MLDIMEHQARYDDHGAFFRCHQMSLAHKPSVPWRNGTVLRCPAFGFWNDRGAQDVWAMSRSLRTRYWICKRHCKRNHCIVWPRRELTWTTESWTCDSLVIFLDSVLHQWAGQQDIDADSKPLNFAMFGSSLDSRNTLNVLLTQTASLLGQHLSNLWLHAKDTGLWPAHRIPF